MGQSKINQRVKCSCGAEGPPRGPEALAAGWTSLSRGRGAPPLWRCPRRNHDLGRVDLDDIEQGEPEDVEGEVAEPEPLESPPSDDSGSGATPQPRGPQLPRSLMGVMMLAMAMGLHPVARHDERRNTG